MSQAVDLRHLDYARRGEFYIAANDWNLAWTAEELEMCIRDRFDLIALVRGDEHPSIIDIKTGGVWPEAYLQLAAYQTAYERQHRKWIERRIVLHVDKKNPGSIIAKDAPHDNVTDWNMFLYALELYRYFNKSEPGKGQIVKITGGKEHD